MCMVLPCWATVHHAGWKAMAVEAEASGERQWQQTQAFAVAAEARAAGRALRRLADAVWRLAPQG